MKWTKISKNWNNKRFIDQMTGHQMLCNLLKLKNMTSSWRHFLIDKMASLWRHYQTDKMTL